MQRAKKSHKGTAKKRSRYVINVVTIKISNALDSSAPRKGNAMIAYMQGWDSKGFLVQYLDKTFLIHIGKACNIDFFFKEEGAKYPFCTR